MNLYRSYRKYKIIAFIILSILGFIFPYDYVDPRTTSTIPLEFINQLGVENIKKYGTLYTPKILPDNFVMENVSFENQTIDNGQEYYIVTTTYKNNNGKTITFIQSNNFHYNNEFIQQHLNDPQNEPKPFYYYFQEGFPQNTLFWVNNENSLSIIYSEQSANDLRNLGRHISSSPINENTIEDYLPK